MRVRTDRRNVGVNFNSTGNAEMKVWSPLATSVALVIDSGETISFAKGAMGYWQTSTGQIHPGTKYKIAIDNNQPLPDPASLSQPLGVNDWSEAIDLNFNWKDIEWKNLPLQSYIMYELHTGTFSPEQNFEGIENKLDYLVDLGINAIEIMPVAQFPGNRNWGYDGVFPFSVQHSYGGAHALQRLVDRCHEKGIAVILDVIYNHLGPEGNYLAAYGPYFTEKYHTPWGKALNFDDAWCDGVRDYFIENALMWFRDFHIDALRMDAVHAIKDLSPLHIIKEIRQHVDQLSHSTGKPYYLITESDLNDPVYINHHEKCGYGANAQWVDEFHHALRVTAGQKPEGYYSDFNGISHLAKSFNDAYVYDGQFSTHRKKLFGKKADNQGDQFVVFSQNHDQTGNRMLGERTSTLVSNDMCKLMAAAVFISPYLPMLFMGEEWGETNPFLFFISHSDEKLAALVNKGRKEEFSYFNWEGEPPDPRLEKTFTDSMLQWDLRRQLPHAGMLDYYKQLINLKKNNPALANTDRKRTKAHADEQSKVLTVERWADNQYLACFLNFSGETQEIHWPEPQPVFASTLANENEIRPASILIFDKK